MLIGKVSINNFRSILSDTFKIEKSITAFVGGNETGKSNVLRAINHFFSEEPFSLEDQHSLSNDSPTIIIEFELTSEENENFKGISGFDFNKKITISKSNEGKKIENEAFKSLVSSGQQEGKPENPEVDIRRAEKEILKMLPQVIFVNVDGLITGRNISVEDMKANVDSPVYKTISNFLAIGGISLEKLESATISQADKSATLKKGSAIIAKKLREYWGQEDIQIDVSCNNTHFTILFLDGGNRPGRRLNPKKTYSSEEVKGILQETADTTREIWTCPEERSNGFRWFVTFYSRYIFGIESGSTKIMLIDDLGNYLHASAQRELLERLKNLGIQVIYATHSFYMVSWNLRDRIYMVKKDEEGTKTNDKWWTRLSSGEVESPLREIGANSIANFLVLSKKNLILDGFTDIIVLNSLAKIFSDEVEAPFLDFGFYIAGGYPEAKPLGKLCEKLGNKSFLVFDSKLEEQEACRSAIADGLKAAHIKSLAKVRKWPIQTIEDLLPRKLLIGETKRICGEVLGEMWVGFESRGTVSTGILSSVEARIKNAGIDDERYKKMQIKNIIKEKVVPSVVEEMTKEDFENTDQKRAIINLLTNLKSNLSSL